MNGSGQPYQQYRRERWEDDGSSSSAYEPGHMSPYREEPRNIPHLSLSNGYTSDQGSLISAEDGPTYVLEHLATFRVSPESGLIYPADGMRRLLHMEKTTGIWTQKMFLKLEKKWVFILSHENGDVVEKFPMELIREPTAFTSGDPKELYNNIFIFVVAEDTKRKYDNPTEMHIFQCLRISAKDVVEDMKLYMSGKALSGRALRGGRGEQIPPAPQEEAPEPPLIGNGFRDFSDVDGSRGEARGARSERSSVSHNDEISSTSSERYERDVAILNNCFDDIERFIARLQHTAAATKELERRRRSRKSKKKDIGDGLLSMRAKPPPEREFVDIFQKFKLSFNLLAKLRAHIRDPNAPELVHFLFTPLALIVDASRDSYFDPSLPPKVVSPLLTRDAVELLTNCLTSRETELWHSLGEAWLVPKEVWKYPVPPYRPVFYSGWAPEISEETREGRYPMYPDRVEADLRRGIRDEFEFYDSDRRESSPPSDIAQQRYRRDPREERPRSMTPMSEFQHEDVEAQNFEKTQRKWLDELKSRNGKIVQVTYPRTANNDKELTVVRGEYLEVLDDSRKWWKAMNYRGQQAHVPHTIVTPYSPDDQPPPPRHAAAPARPPKRDECVNLESSDDEGTVVPDKPIPSPPPLPSSDSQEGSISDKEPIRPVASKNIFGSTKSHADLMNEELKLVLQDFRKARPHLEINKTPDVFINQSSTPEEVHNWLQLKGFNERICKKFQETNGQQIFKLSRIQLEDICGKSDGTRLDSQITIQRNISGYKTTRSSELRQILANQRKKVDGSIPQECMNTNNKPQRSEVINLNERMRKTPHDEDSVSANFKFLSQYENTEVIGGYDSSEESETDSRSTQNSLRDQIKRQHKNILKQPDAIASR